VSNDESRLEPRTSKLPNEIAVTDGKSRMSEKRQDTLLWLPPAAKHGQSAGSMWIFSRR
jgi:hypothetical protein